MKIVVAVVFAFGCSSHDAAPCAYNGHTYALGDEYPAGDGCNSCTCTADGSSCTKRACSDAGVDANPMSCAASGGCPQGPACGVYCCGFGEKCVLGACKCGSAAACGQGDQCEAPGPIGGDACGSLCCGATGPCPQ